MLDFEKEGQKIIDYLLADGGFSKEELAAKLKVSTYSITNWRDGTRNLSYATYCFLRNLYFKVKACKHKKL